ncbi:MAG: hypothetical protein AMXMBFR64_37830 [Myxococcales bacterium]
MVPTPHEAGVPFGRYFLVRRIGSGGMGEVWLAKARGAAGFEKSVVIKRILPHLGNDPEFLQRLVEEGRLVVQLTHGNIVQVYDLEVTDGETYIAMEYVDGFDLRELLRRAPDPARPFPPSLALHVIEELSAGLAYAHERTDERGAPLHIVHRDISPSNVMVSRDGAVKLLDFGIARSAGTVSRSVAGTLRGKFPYMSPEQARGEDLDPRSDLFGVGALAYEMLTGRRPFDDPSELRILERVQRHEPPTVGVVAPEVPPALSALVMRCLMKRPEDRYGSAAELRRAAAETRVALGIVVTSADLAALVRERAAAAAPLSLDEALALQVDRAARATPDGTRTAVPGPGVSTSRPGTPAPLPPMGDAPVTGTGQLVPPTRPQRLLLLLLALAVAVLVYFNVRYVLRDQAQPATAARPEATLPQPQDPPDTAPTNAPVPAPDPPAPRASREAEPSEAVALRQDLETDWERPRPPKTRAVTIRSSPPGAELRVEGLPPTKAPRTFQLPAERAVSGVARLPGYAEQPFTVASDGPRALTVTLTALARGTVQFRFFPADSRVLINDAVVATGGSNLVRKELPAGRYRLVVQSRDGESRTSREFEIREGEERSLGTVALSAESAQP